MPPITSDLVALADDRIRQSHERAGAGGWPRARDPGHRTTHAPSRPASRVASPTSSAASRSFRAGGDVMAVEVVQLRLRRRTQRPHALRRLAGWLAMPALLVATAAGVAPPLEVQRLAPGRAGL
jgi:hypothetical protein